MLAYRAVLTGVKLERPMQHFSNTLQETEHWALTILKKHPKGTVQIYKTEEVLVGERTTAEVEK